MTGKNKDKINFDKRGYHSAPLANIMPKMMKKLGGVAQAKNTASMIKLLNHWPAIIGQDMAVKTMPERISFHQQKNRQTGEQEKFRVLKIKAESAVVTALAMREAIILERLNRLFGAEDFKKLTFIQGSMTACKSHIKPQKANAEPLTLPDIVDPVLKSRLESLGQAVMNSATK
jgi:hypothetical protein